MIVLKEASKRYGENGANTLALNSVSFTLPDTGMVFLVGKSGAGKSTLLNALGGLEPLTGGEILYNGNSLSSFSEKDWDHYRKQTVSFCFQKMNVLPPLTVEENVRLNESRYSPERIREILRSVDMEGMEKRKTSTLSGGQQQRVAIARALYRDSPILLCDEPTGSLDSATASQVFVCLKQASSSRLILIVTHDEASAERYGDRIIRLKDGEVIEDKVIRQVEAAPAPRPGEAKEPKKRSHLSAKLLAHSLFHRPGRLAAAVLLMGLSIGILMPILSMTTRDSGAMLLSSIEHENEPYASYAKARASGNKNVSRKMYDSDWKSLFPKKDEALPFYALSSLETESGSAPVANLDYRADTSSYPLSGDELGQAVLTDSSGLCPIDEAKAQKMGFSLVSGIYPTREEEAMITLAEYQVIRRHGWKLLDSSSSYSPTDISTPEAFLKKSPQFRMIWNGSFQETTIVGVLDTHFDGSSYAKLPAEGDGSLRSEMMRATLTPYLLYGPHTALYVSPSYAEKNFVSPTTSDLSGESFYLDDFYSPFLSLEKADEGSDSLLPFSVTSKGAYLPMGALATAYGGDAALTLPEGIKHKDYSYCASLGHDFAEVPESEEVASPSFLFDLSASGHESNLSFLAAGNYVEENGLPTGEAYDSFVSWVQKVYDARARQGYESVDFSSLDETKEGYLKSFYVWELASVSMPGQGFVEDGYDSNPFGGPNGISLTKELAQKIFAANPPAEKSIHFEVNSIFSGKKERLECPLAGISLTLFPRGNSEGIPLLLQSGLFDEWKLFYGDGGNISFLLEKTPGKKALEKAVRGFSTPHGEYFLENRVIAGYNRFGDQFYRTFVGIGAGASAIFLALEVLILIMLGSVYARDRTPEMRLRRAMGASKAKVYGLLTAETLMVGLIGFAFSLLFGFPIAAALNSYLASSSGIYFSLFSISFVGVAIAFAVTAILSFLSSISPAFSGSKKSLAGALNQGD